MINWQKKTLSGGAEIGEPAALPLDLQGLSESSLADLDWTDAALGYRGFGYVPVIDLTDLRAEAVARVNAEAGAFRRRFITDIPGQIGTYLAKEAEAKAYATDQGADCPYLESEARATNRPVGDVATEVSQTAARWRKLDAAIEGARRGAVLAIEGALTADRISAAGFVDWEALLG